LKTPLAWLEEALSIVSASDKLYVSMAVATYLFSTVLYSLRTVIVMRRMGIPLSLRDAYIAYLLNILVNNITPGARAGGELARAAYIARRYKASLPSLINIIAFERATEAAGIVSLMLIALVYGIFDQRDARYLAVLSSLIFAGLLALYKYWDRLFNFAMAKLEKRGWVKYDASSTMRFSELFHDHLLLAVSVAIGATVWFLDAVRLYLIGRAIGVHLGVAVYVGVSALYAVVGLFAVTPGGVGIVEGGLAAILIAVGIEPGDALAIALIERLISYGLGTLLGVLGLLAAGGRRAWKTLRIR